MRSTLGAISNDRAGPLRQELKVSISVDSRAHFAATEPQRAASARRVSVCDGVGLGHRVHAIHLREQRLRFISTAHFNENI